MTRDMLAVAVAVASAVSVAAVSPVLAHANPGGNAPTSAGGGMNLLDLDYPRETVFLTPGDISSWDVSVAFVPDFVDRLVLELSNPSGGSTALDGLIVSANACSVPFTVEGCPGTRFEVLPPVPASTIPTSNLALSPPASGLRDVIHVRVDVSTSPTALADAGSESLQIQLLAAASGGATDSASSSGENESRLPHTGVALGKHLLLAIAAIIMGTLIARFGREAGHGNTSHNAVLRLPSSLDRRQRIT